MRAPQRGWRGGKEYVWHDVAHERRPPPGAVGCAMEGDAGEKGDAMVVDAPAEQAAAVVPAAAARSKRTDAEVIRRAAALKDAKAKAEAAMAAAPYEVARPRTHWDFLLQEMAWMAADFAGERLWKMAAASKLAGAACHAAETHAARPAAPPQNAVEDKAGQGRQRRGGGALAAGVTGALRPCVCVQAACAVFWCADLAPFSCFVRSCQGFGPKL
jgi:hypothetical protein